MTNRILVVEDNEINQKIILANLRSLGFAVVLAETGQQAINFVRSEDFGLIFMDYHMPEMDGIACTRAIRELQQEHALLKTPVIALTADISPDAMSNCIAAGMNGYLSKPYTKSQLTTVLSKWIKQS